MAEYSQVSPNSVGTVKHIQQLLNAKGYAPPLTEDGSWGPLTQAAVLAFQFLNGVAYDGIVGPITLNLLKTTAGKKFSGVIAVPPSSGVVQSQPISPHSVTFNRYNDTRGLTAWIADACRLRNITDPTAIANWTHGIVTAAGRESSGDPNACNTNDLNDVTPAGYSMVQDWGNGYGDPSGELNGQLVNFQCSRGVVQDIPETFAANWCPGSTVNIYDAPSGIAATMGYVVNDYGVSWDGSNLAQQVQQFDPTRPAKGY